MRKLFGSVIGIGVRGGQARDQAYSIIIQTIIQFLIATVLAMSMTSCALDRVLKTDTEKPMTPTPISTTGSRRPWTASHNWAYWLDNPDLKQISATNFELVVIDYSADGSAKRAFTAQQIAQLRSSSFLRLV